MFAGVPRVFERIHDGVLGVTYSSAFVFACFWHSPSLSFVYAQRVQQVFYVLSQFLLIHIRVNCDSDDILARWIGCQNVQQWSG